MIDLEDWWFYFTLRFKSPEQRKALLLARIRRINISMGREPNDTTRFEDEND